MIRRGVQLPISVLDRPTCFKDAATALGLPIMSSNAPLDEAWFRPID